MKLFERLHRLPIRYFTGFISVYLNMLFYVKTRQFPSSPFLTIAVNAIEILLKIVYPYTCLVVTLRNVVSFDSNLSVLDMNNVFSLTMVAVFLLMSVTTLLQPYWAYRG